MTNFLIQEIAHYKRLDVAAVDLHVIPWRDPTVLRDDKSCERCENRHPRIWATCNKENLIVSSNTSLTILDYESIVEDYYKGKDKPKHCDFVIEGEMVAGGKKIALCDLTCQMEKYVNNPSESKNYPTGKREYAWTQMEETIQRWQSKAGYSSMISQYTKKEFIFGWRDPDVKVIRGDKGSKAMTDFANSTTSALVKNLSYGTRGDFELIQVKYPATYQW